MPHVFKCGHASKREQDTIGAYTWASLYQTSVRVFCVKHADTCECRSVVNFKELVEMGEKGDKEPQWTLFRPRRNVELFMRLTKL